MPTYPHTQGTLPPPEPLHTLGPYQIDGVLGQGAAAVVYRARRADGTPAALKVLDRAAANNPKLRRAFEREMQIMLRLNHPHIVRAFDVGQLDGRYYIAMNHVEGETLDGLLARVAKLGEAPAVELAIQLAQALDYLHGRGIVHRDIKPANVLLAQGSRALLFDFGTALDLAKDEPTPGAVYGTPAFVAPEQARGDPVIDGRADLYALGAVLYRMVAGRKPFYGSRGEVLEAHVNQAPPPPSRFAYVSPSLEAAILKALEKDPADRFATGAEMAAALDGARRAAPPPRPDVPQRILHWLRNAVIPPS